MKPADILYDFGLSAGRTVLPRTPFLPRKLRRGIEARRGLLARVEGWAREHRTDAPLVWFHAPSVGEGLQTRPVIESLRELQPDLQILYTFFSPSAETLARQMPADYADYMPFDLVPDLMRFMEAVVPAVIVFGKADVWPNVTRVACWREAKLALVSGTVAATSSRLRWPARAFLSSAYARLDAAGAISADDATRLAQLGVDAQRIEITGDARFDQVHQRALNIDRSAPPLSLLAGHDGVTLVAGSTWPEDERHLLVPLAKLRARHPQLRTLLVPHEPTPNHLAKLEVSLDRAALQHVRFSSLETGDAQQREVIVVDRVGLLGELYGLADIAYVGGGFGRAGLHSVLEPATFSAPTLFGPRHANAREAADLIERGGAISADDGAGLQEALGAWLDDEEARRTAGAAAFAYVQENLGAGRRSAELVSALLQK